MPTRLHWESLGRGEAIQHAYGVDHELSDAELAGSCRDLATIPDLGDRHDACASQRRSPMNSTLSTAHEAVPEGDTVWRACWRLNEVLAGRMLTRSEFRVPSLAATDLTGIAVRQVISRGKHQLFRFSNDVTLHTHFKMDGVWKIYPRGRRWSGGPDFQIRAVLATGDHDIVGYRLPIVELVPTADEDTVVGHLGL